MSSATSQVSEIEKQATLWLEDNTRLHPAACRALASLTPGLAVRLACEAVTVLAVAGPPGSGKTTLARLLADMLSASGRPATLLSLDDYYLSQAQRSELALGHHPLLAHRGVPGTHDWRGFLRDIDALREGRIDGLRLPVFNKSTDDVEPERFWRRVEVRPSLLIIEGWCIGSPAQEESSLREPINPMEREQDPDGAWRHHVNQELAIYRADLQQRVERFWYLRVPDWACVIEWRRQQEQELDQPRLSNRAEVEFFLATFQRIVAHMQSTCADWADCLLACDRSHHMGIIR